LLGHYPLWFLIVLLSALAASWSIGHNGISTILTDFPSRDRPLIASLNSSIRFIAGGIGFYISSLFVEGSFAISFFVIGLLMLILVLTIRRLLPSR
jgi:hypothetical protein